MQFLIARAPQVKADLRVILKRLDEGLGMDVEGVEVRVWGACACGRGADGDKHVVHFCVLSAGSPNPCARHCVACWQLWA